MVWQRQHFLLLYLPGAAPAGTWCLGNRLGWRVHVVVPLCLTAGRFGAPATPRPGGQGLRLFLEKFVKSYTFLVTSIHGAQVTSISLQKGER